MLRLDVGIAVSSGDVRGLVNSLVPVLHRAPGEVGVLVNTVFTDLPVQGLLRLLHKIRQHENTRAVAILTPYSETMLDAGHDSLQFFNRENEALAWLRERLAT